MPFPVFDKPRRPALAPTDSLIFIDHLGDPLPVFVHKDIPARDTLCHLVTHHGGHLTPTMRHAVYLIVDPMSSDGQDTIDGYGDRPDKRVLRPEWLHLSVAGGKLAIANDWAGCRLGRTLTARKRPADDLPDPAPKQPRTDPAPVSYQYNPGYPIVPGYYPNPQPYPYYDPAPQPQPAPSPPIKKRNPRPPRQPNRPWTLEENVALYTFMAQHPAPSEREQATLVRRWAKETRPDRGRQSWVAHAFATSFKNWVKEYEAGNVNANPADFNTGADADAEAEADPDHDDPPFAESSQNGQFAESQNGQFQEGQMNPPASYAGFQAQYTATASTSTQAQTYTSPPAQQYTSPPSSAQNYTSPPSSQTYTSPSSSSQNYSQPQSQTPAPATFSATPAASATFSTAQATSSTFSSAQATSPNFPATPAGGSNFPTTPAGSSNFPTTPAGTTNFPTTPAGAEEPTETSPAPSASGSNAAGFPPMYPMVYPPANGEADTKEGA